MSKFINKYKRVTNVIPEKGFTDELLGEDDEDFSIDYDPLHGHKALMFPPFKGHNQAFRMPMDIFPKGTKQINDLLVYRILKKSFGEPDPILIYVDFENGKGFLSLWHWSYSFHGKYDVIYELRSEIGKLFYYCWFPENMEEPEDNDQIAEFDNDFFTFIDVNAQNLPKFDFKKEISKQSTKLPHSLINVYADKIKAGDSLLDLAKVIDRPVYKGKQSQEAMEETSDPTGEFTDKGAYYLSAAIYYLMALEGFANFLLKTLIYDEFNRRTYWKVTIELPIDLRLITLSNYCRGFEKNGLSPSSETYKKLRSLTKFRNNIIHNNVTEEHEIHIMTEDNFYFSIHPDRDKDKNANIDKLPVYREKFEEEHAVYVKNTVREIIDAVISGMNKECREWTNVWINQRFIMLNREGEEPWVVDMKFKSPPKMKDI